MNEMTIYWITRLDGINALLCLCWIISLIAVAFGFLSRVSTPEHDKRAIAVENKCMAIGFSLFALFLLVFVFTPTTKEMIAIKGIPAVVDVAKSHSVGEKAERVCNALVKIIEDKANGK